MECSSAHDCARLVVNLMQREPPLFAHLRADGGGSVIDAPALPKPLKEAKGEIEFRNVRYVGESVALKQIRCESSRFVVAIVGTQEREKHSGSAHCRLLTPRREFAAGREISGRSHLPTFATKLARSAGDVLV